jgi:CBS domain-containing protein
LVLFFDKDSFQLEVQLKVGRTNQMQVKDIMTRDVEIARRDTLLSEAAERMRGHDIGMLPVCDGDQLVGMVTDRDITVRATANKLHPEMVRCQDVMTPNVVFCFEDQDVADAGAIMQKHKIRRLPVVNRQRRLVGIISIGDIALGTGDTKLVGVSVQEISAPDAPKPLPGQKRE